MSSRHITIVAHDVGATGGMERQLSDLITGLLAHDLEVTVVARSCALSPGPGLRWIRVRGPARPFVLAYPWFLIAGSLRLRSHRRGLVHAVGAIVLNRVDVVAVHFCHHGYSAKAQVVRAGRPGPLYHLHARLAAALARLGERALLRPSRARIFAGVSSDVADELRDWLPRTRRAVRVLPNGVDTLRFRPQRTSQPVGDVRPRAIFVGGEWERKGLRFAIEGAALAGWGLVIAGEGDEERYAALARSLGCDGGTKFLGPVPKVETAYASADAFVLPSAYETFSLATHEAAACGLPVLATAVGGVRDLIQPGVNGFFITRDAQDVARALGRLRDRSTRERMGVAARRSALEYDRASMVTRHLELYEELSR